LSSLQSHCLVMNSSVIIAPVEINMVDIISVLNIELIVPHAVYKEVVAESRGRPGSKELETLINQGKVKVLTPENGALVEALHDPLGMGESEAIALAVEHSYHLGSQLR